MAEKSQQMTLQSGFYIKNNNKKNHTPIASKGREKKEKKVSQEDQRKNRWAYDWE